MLSRNQIRVNIYAEISELFDSLLFVNNYMEPECLYWCEYNQKKMPTMPHKQKICPRRHINIKHSTTSHKHKTCQRHHIKNMSTTPHKKHVNDHINKNMSATPHKQKTCPQHHINNKYVHDVA